jgi:signal recognition particle subunit SRP72
MAAKSSEVSVMKLFSQLQLAGEDGDYEWSLDVIKEILKLSPEDYDALSCQVVALIQTSQLNDAVRLINKLSKLKDNRGDGFVYERAYCLYKEEKYSQSLALMEKLSDSVGVADLKAQVYYRMEEYEESVKCFQRGLELKEGSERKANMAAGLAYCHGNMSRDLLGSASSEEMSMEECFNMATVHLMSTKKYNMAEPLLRQAEMLCKESYALEEDEIEQELIPIYLQLGYCCHLMGRHDDAMALYGNVLRSKPSSAVHTLTAANNVIVLNGDKDIFDSKKKIKLMTNAGATKKLSKWQLQIVTFNRFLFALKLNQLEQARQLLVELKEHFPSTDLTVMAEACLFHREKKISDAINVLRKYVTCTSGASIDVHLMLAEFHCLGSGLNEACDVIENIPGLSKYIGLVAVLVNQLKSSGEIDRCMKILDDAFKWWMDCDDAQKRLQVLWEIAKFKLSCNRPQEAAQVLEYLCRQDMTNINYLATLISAYSRFAPQKADELSNSLPKVKGEMTMDVDSLEHMPTFHHSRRDRKPQDKVVDMADSSKEKRKKKRKKRLPKNYDPSKAPDPERWMPLRERSYYKKSKKRGHGGNPLRGTQGMTSSMSGVTAKLDASRTSKPEVTTPATNDGASPRPSQQQKKSSSSQQHKKKKKGKR